MLIDISHKNEFSKKVEDYVLKHNSSYLDAVLNTAQEYNIEPEAAAKLISRPIIEKLSAEGKELNLVKNNKSRLPF